MPKQSLNPKSFASPRAPGKRLVRLGRKDLQLREDVLRAHEQSNSMARDANRDAIRRLHLAARSVSKKYVAAEMQDELMRFASLFPDLNEIDPLRIAPRLVLVRPRTDEERVFRLCRATWSLPGNKGYGRRLRFLVVDDYHEAIIGVIGLQSPPADLGCRDTILGCAAERKLAVVNATMDAYAVGAVGAYAPLLGGKLIAGLLCSDEIRTAYWRVYGGATSLMNKVRHLQPLLAVTTTSAYGRSSQYNKVHHEQRVLAERIGQTRGFGTLHLEHLYARLLERLSDHGLVVPSGFGNGPKVRWQNIQNALQLLRLPNNCLQHGLMRDVYLFRHVSNLEAVARDAATPDPLLLTVMQHAEYWKRRWASPRKDRLLSSTGNVCTLEMLHQVLARSTCD